MIPLSNQAVVLVISTFILVLIAKFLGVPLTWATIGGLYFGFFVGIITARRRDDTPDFRIIARK